MPSGLRKLTVFEDFGQYNLDIFQPDGDGDDPIDPVRILTAAVGASFAITSLKLGELSVIFMVDALHLFQVRQPQWSWSRFQSLTLTSRLMTPIHPEETKKLLRDAGQAALCMSQLHTMVLWNSAGGEACSFTYSRENISLTWRGNWIPTRPDSYK